MANLSQAVKLLHKEHQRVQSELSRIDAALQALGNTNHSSRPRRTMSLAGRRRIAAAQRARWAKVKGHSTGRNSGRPRRTLSADARKRIAAAQRKRWAKFKKAQKAS